MTRGRVLVAVIAALVVTGCAVRMGGPSPADVDAAVVTSPANASADQVAQQLVQGHVEYAILSAPRDTGFFREVARRANLTSTRPGNLGTTTFAFIGPKALGDTTLSLNVPGGGQVRIHDALFRIDKTRTLDLLAARIEPNANLQRAVETLLKYVADDVGPTAALLLAVEPPTPALGDSVSVLTRAAFSDVWECTRESKSGGSSAQMPVRVFAGPAVRLRCESAQLITGPVSGVLGHFEMPR